MGKRSHNAQKKIKKLTQRLASEKNVRKRDRQLMRLALAVLSLRYPNMAQECDRVARSISSGDTACYQEYERLKDAHYKRNCWS